MKISDKLANEMLILTAYARYAPVVCLRRIALYKFVLIDRWIDKNNLYFS